MSHLLLTSNITSVQLAFFIVVPVILAIFLFVCIYVPLSILYKRKNFQIHFYKKVYRVALDNDFYLINQFLFKVDTNRYAKVDHILFGDKFIYVIASKYYEGDLVGKYSDSSLIFVSHKGKKAYTDNPLFSIKNLTTKLSSCTGIDASMMIGIVLINDDCHVAVQSESKQFYIIQRKHLAALIKAIESRPVPPINEKELAKAVQSIAKINKKKKDKE